MSAPGWPAVLTDGDVTLRPLRMRDASAWVESRRRNTEWLRPWEATPPGGPSTFGTSRAVFTAMTRRLRSDARHGTALPFVIVVGRTFAGQLNVAGIVHGSMDSAHIGYWVDQRVAGRGVMPTAVALAVDHCFRRVGTAPGRGEHPSGERREPARRREAGLSRGGRPRALSAHLR